MRFKRADLPGMVIAMVAPVAMMLLLLASYELWDHHGSPLLGILSANLAIGAGLLAAFYRFFKARDVLLGLLLALLLVVVSVIALQRTDNDGTVLAASLKLAGVGIFLALNAAIVHQLLVHGLEPVLARRDERRAAEQETT